MLYSVLQLESVIRSGLLISEIELQSLLYYLKRALSELSTLRIINTEYSLTSLNYLVQSF